MVAYAIKLKFLTDVLAGKSYCGVLIALRITQKNDGEQTSRMNDFNLWSTLYRVCLVVMEGFLFNYIIVSI
jgi:hypothetical protein